MFEKINIIYLIAAFSVGIGYIYIVTPPPQVVMKFPSPNNTKSLVYTDASNNCYKYEHEHVDCKHGNVKHQPVLENFNSSL
jgi:hypothetical protein